MELITDTRFRSAYRLSTVVAVLMFVQSASGLLRADLYRDIPWITAGWRGNDVVTLFIAVPMLISALILVRRGSLRAQLVWLGMLFYSLYNYPYIAGTILMVADTVYMLALLAFSPFGASAGIAGAWDQAPAWALFGVGCLLASASLLTNMQSREGERHARAA